MYKNILFLFSINMTVYSLWLKSRVTIEWSGIQKIENKHTNTHTHTHTYTHIHTHIHTHTLYKYERVFLKFIS